MLSCPAYFRAPCSDFDVLKCKEPFMYRPTHKFPITIGLVFCATFSAPAGERKQLTHDGRIKMSPVFVDADELVYVDMDEPEMTTLKRLRLDDGSTARLHPQAKTQELEPAFSKDGRRCAFVQTRGTLSLALVIRNEIDKREVEIPPAGGFSGYRTPSFSPDGRRIIYSFAEGGFQNLYSVDSQAQHRKQLTTSGGHNYWPSYSPDGKRILFGSTRDGNFDIYSMAADGKDVRRLTDHPFQDLRPRFSPDGSRIAFTSSRDGNYEVYVMNSDGTAVTRVTRHSERDDYATWHPDGKRLAMVSERDGAHDLYLVELTPESSR